MRVKSRVVLIAAFSLVLLLAIGGLVVAQDGNMEEGKELFAEYCAVCHGYDGEGRVGAALNDWFASIDPGAFLKATVREGVAGTMPAFAQEEGGPLTDQQIDSIAMYVLSWQDRVEPAPTPTLIPVTPIPTVAGVLGDPMVGAQIYARECQVCHGEQGAGGVGATLSEPIAASQPAAFLRNTIEMGVAGSPMPAFGDLLDADAVNDVVAYILSWERTRPVQPTPEPEPEDGFNWLVGVAFLIILLLVGIWLIVRFSGRQTEP